MHDYNSKYINNRKYSKDIYINVGKLSYWALFFYIISLFIFVDNPQLVFISRTIFIIFSALTIVALIVRKKVVLDNTMILLSMFYIFSILSYTWAIDKDDVVRKIFLMGQLLLLFFLVVQSLTSIRAIEIILKAIAVSGIVLFFYAIIIYGFDNIIFSIISGTRIGREISQENTMGRLAAISCISLLNLGIDKNKKSYFFLIIMPFIIVLASGSRTAIGVLIVGIFFNIFLKNRIRKKYRYLYIIPITVMIIYVLSKFSIFYPIRLRFLELYGAFSNDSGDGVLRLNMVKWGLKWFSEKPILGYGIGNYGELLKNKIGSDTYSHNNFIELLVGTGLIGFLLYYSVYIYIFYNLYKDTKRKIKNSSSLLTIFFVWTCAEIGAVNYTSKMTYILMGICIASFCIRKRSNIFEEM